MKNHIVLRVYDPLQGSGLRIPVVEDCDSRIRITTLRLATLCELREANCCATNRCGGRAVFIARKQVQTPVFLAVEQAYDTVGQCKSVKQLSASGGWPTSCL